ncbi:hypothetical protein MTX20_14020 [Bradyrhizobium sp. ISRA435]|nr:hypothetical protein MTX20_14020 [Bradyrhizobium sp. ISRA435]
MVVANATTIMLIALRTRAEERGDRKEGLMSRHVKLKKPIDTDLHRNPLIGGSKGVTMAQARPDDVDALEGENTFEGDVENDTNPQGGVEKRRRRAGRSRRGSDHGGPSRSIELQGRITHEQQLRILERKPDIPDARQVGQDIARLEENSATRRPKRNARQSEFPVSRGGLNQESRHNKHNHPKMGNGTMKGRPKL